MSRDKIQQLVGSLVKSLDDNEKMATPILSAKLAKCLEAYPHDKTLGSMSIVLEKMASNNKLFICKAELKELYSKHYSNNTKFAELFQDELGAKDIVTEPVPEQYKRDDSLSLDPYESANPVLANALSSLFDKGSQLKMYSKKLADKAIHSVGSTLDAWSLKPTRLFVDQGNEKFLILKAEYETPKGVTSIYVPVETVNDQIIESEVFMGNKGPQELNNTEIKAYIKANAGIKLKVGASGILNVLTKAATEGREVSDAEMAVTRLNESRQQRSEFFEGQIVGQKISEASVKDVQLPKYDDFASFESKFTSPQGIASFTFGDDKIKTAKEYIVREVISMGYKNPQITVTGSDESSIHYGVSLDGGKVAFTVPVKISNGTISQPNLLLCNGSVSTFNKSGINSLYVNNQTDFKIAAAASPQFGLKPSDLINNIRDAVIEGNNAKAEDALNILASSGDEKAYATGFQVFLNGIGGVKKAEVSCSMLVKNSKVSEHAICGHTGLPVHKVYQDKEGNCRPLYRRGMDETYEGASFMNSKIFG